MSEACQLCGRAGLPLTRHHLIPRARHNKGRTRRQFDRPERLHSIALLCRACHRHCHAILTEKELAESYTSLEALQQHPEIAKFTAWIQNKPPGFQPLSRTSRSRQSAWERPSQPAPGRS